MASTFKFRLKIIRAKVGSILDFSFDTISILVRRLLIDFDTVFSISVESVKLQRKKNLALGWGK